MAQDIFERFKRSMEIKFGEDYGDNKQGGTDITSKTEKFYRLGPEQSPRKREMIKAGKEIAAKEVSSATTR